MSVFSDRLRQAMADRKYSIVALSIRTGIDERTIQRYRAGQNEPGSYSLRMIAKALNTSTDWLLGIDEEENQ